MIVKSDYKCCQEGPNNALFACIEDACQKFALMCGNGSCQCRTHHRDHRIFQLQDILRNLDETPNLPKESEERFQLVEKLINDLMSELSQLKWKHSQSIRQQSGKRPTMDEFARMCQDKEHANGKFFSELVNKLRGEKKELSLYQLSQEDVQRHTKAIRWEMNLLKYRIERLWMPRYSFGACPATIVLRKGALQAIKTTDDVSPNNALALVQPRLSMTAPSEISFRVDSLTDWVAFGVCLRTPFTSKGLKHDLSKLQHGSYMVSTHQFMFSHSKREDNQVRKSSIKAKAGDIVTVAYDPTTKLMTAKTSAHQQTIETDIHPSTQDAVHFCVGFCYSKGQAASIE